MSNIDDIFELSNSSFIDELFDFIMERGFDSDTANDIEKTFIYVVTAVGLLGNGGFKYFFENDFDEGKVPHEEVISHFEKIGSSKTAETLRKSLNIFPGAKPQKNLAKRSAFLEKFFDPETSLHLPAQPLPHFSQSHHLATGQSREVWQVHFLGHEPTTYIP